MTKLFIAFAVLIQGLTASAQDTSSLRLVSLTPAITETLQALGAGPNIVGADQYSALPNIPVVADYRQANIEAILKLDPTHVIGWQESVKPGLIEQLAAFGIPLLQTRTRTLDDWIDSTRDIADRLGLDPAPISAWANGLADLEAEYSNRSAVSTVWIFWDRPLMVSAGAGFTSELMQICGARNVFADLNLTTATIDPEALIRSAPNLLIGQSDWAERWQWDAPPRLWEPPADILARAGPHLPQGAAELCAAVDSVRKSL